MPLRSVKDAKLRGRRAIVRVDMNVPFDHRGRIRDDFRIRESLATMRLVLNRGGSVFVILHRGRPEGRDPKLSIAPIAKRAAEILGRSVSVVADPLRARPEDYAKERLVFSENVRFFAGEDKNSAAFAKNLARWGDLYVNDAFAVSHRKAASVAGIPRYLPSYSGLLMEKELKNLDALKHHSRHPFVVILGGAKAETKIPYIGPLLKKADKLIAGGVISNTIWASWGHETGRSLVEKSQFANARKLRHARKLLIPEDVCVLGDDASRGYIRVVKHDAIRADDYILDVGPAAVKRFTPVLEKARTVLWNGPLGDVDHLGGDEATRSLAQVLKKSRARVMIGGGDLEAVLKKEKVGGRRFFVSTGGGAMLEYVAYGTLPGIKALAGK